jgi:hypothetical protein
MNAFVFGLLKDYLRRSVGVWLPLVLLQCALITAYWLLHSERVPLVGALIGFAGAINALDPNSLVWRSVPLPAREAAAMRWWATAGIPGIFSTLCFGVVWIAHRLAGWAAPSAGIAVESVLAVWAVLGFLAVLPHRMLMPARRGEVPRALLLMAALLFPLAFGLPLLGTAAQPYFSVAIAIGLGMLAVAALRVQFRNTWRWPDLATLRPNTSTSTTTPATTRDGWLVLLWPILRRTAVLAIASLGGITLLRWVFPNATVPLMWIYLLSVSISGVLITWHRRSALHALRCLPIGVSALALAIQAIGLLPSTTVYALTVVVNRIFPMLGIDVPVTMLVVFVSSQIIFDFQDQKLQNRDQGVNRYRGKWLAIVQRLVTPAWVAAYSYTFISRGWPLWVSWVIAGVGLGLCILSHFTLIWGLRAGIRPGRGQQDILTA